MDEQIAKADDETKREKLQARRAEIAAMPLYADITDDVARVIEHELCGVYEGEGWKQWKSLR
jgi:hypothetical protein